MKRSGGKGNWDKMTEHRLRTNYDSFLQVFPDVSKEIKGGKNGFAFVITQLGLVILEITPDHLSVYTVEIVANYFSLQWMEPKIEKG